jgi:nucleotide-binding universal stress UspA family protein
MFRTLLVHVNPDAASTARVQIAISLAQRFEATLIGITAGIPQLPIELYSASLGVVAVGDISDFNRKQLEAEFGKATDLFENLTKNSGLETSWRAVFEAPSAAIVDAGAAADLLIVGPGDRSLLGDLRTVAAGDIVMRTGRPVLVVPENAPSIPASPNVLVAWKNTAEAQRALSDALPFLKEAGSVTVAHVQETAELPPDITDAVGFLLRHGVAAKAHSMAPGDDGAGAQLLELASRSQTDLIVAGAYGHSKLREWAFGGVTRELLTRSKIACLLSH